MIDEAEDAANTTEKFTISAIRQRKPVPQIRPRGRCFNCNAKVSKHRRWCDAICRNEWASEQGKS